jgi:hypothetical protein
MTNKQLLSRLAKASWCCSDCGNLYGKYPKGHMSTWHVGKCDICRRSKPITEARDFGYLRVGQELLMRKIWLEKEERQKSEIQDIKNKFATKLEKAKPKKKTQLKTLKDTLWKLISTKVRNSSDRCYTCDKPLDYRDRSTCHFWSRGGHGATRFDEDNLRVGCNTCNTFKSGNLAEYATRLLGEIGQERYGQLYERAHKEHRFSSEEISELIKKHENKSVN